MEYWFCKKIQQPPAALAITVFITIMFGSIRSYAILALAAFINSVEIIMIRVPLTKKLMF